MILCEMHKRIKAAPQSCRTALGFWVIGALLPLSLLEGECPFAGRSFMRTVGEEAPVPERGKAFRVCLSDKPFGFRRIIRHRRLHHLMWETVRGRFPSDGGSADLACLPDLRNLGYCRFRVEQAQLVVSTSLSA